MTTLRNFKCVMLSEWSQTQKYPVNISIHKTPLQRKPPDKKKGSPWCRDGVDYEGARGFGEVAEVVRILIWVVTTCLYVNYSIWTARLLPESSPPGLFSVFLVYAAASHLSANSYLLFWSNNLNITSSEWWRIFCDSLVKVSVPPVTCSLTSWNFSFHDSSHLR